MSELNEMQRRVAAFDWSRTSLGPREWWPKSLTAVIEMLLAQKLGMIVLWGQDVIQIYNDAYAVIAGNKHPDGLGRSNYAVWPEAKDVTAPLYRRVLAGESISLEDQPFMLARRGAEPEETFLTVSYSPVPDDDGRVAGILAVVIETTGKIRAEQARLQAQAERDRVNEQRRLAFDAAQLGWWHLDPATGAVTWDERVQEIYGLPPGETAVAAVMAQMQPDDRRRVAQAMEAAMNPADPKPYTVQYRLTRPDGSVRWIESLGQAKFEGDGAGRKAVAFYGTASDITERKLAEEQTELLGVLGPMLLPLTDPQEIMERTTQAIGLHLRAGRCYFAEWDEARGRVAVPAEWPLDAVPRLEGVYDLQDFGPEQMRHQMAEAVFRVSDVEELPQLKVFLPNYRTLGFRAFATAPFKRDSERVVTLTVTADHPRLWRVDEMAVVENVLARTWPLVERARAELHSRLLVRLSQMLAEVNDPDEIVRAATRMVGEHLSVTRCYFFEDAGDGNRVRVTEDWRPASAGSIVGEYALDQFGTPEWWAAVKTRPMALHDTARESQVDAERYRLLDIGAFATAPFLREGRWVAGLAVAAPRSRRWTEDELTLLENVIARVWPVVERVRVAQMLSLSNARLSLALAAGNLGDFSWDLSSNEVLVSPRTMELFDLPAATRLSRSLLQELLHPDDAPRASAANAHALLSHTDYDFEYRVRQRDGSWRWIAAKGRGVYNEKGEPVGMRGVVQDINDRKLTEEKLRAQEAQLRLHAGELEQRVAERTASLQEAISQMEEFSYSVSHDLRGPLRAMHAYASALKEDCGEQLDDTGRRYLERIQLSSLRMEQLTHDILTYSRIARSEVALVPIDLNRLISEVVSQYVQLQPPHAEVQVASPLPAVLGHESSLGQVISNLLTNAEKFVAPGVKPFIRIASVAEGARVRVWIEDNGIGITQADQSRLFRVFERLPTDVKYEGTGIGLAIVRKAIEKMGGHCGVVSDGTHGSQFWIELNSPR